MREVMDESDMGTLREEQAREIAVAVRKQEGPAFSGCCALCGDPVDAPRRWCDADCRDQWERVHAAR